jgi:hypothetical protein
MKLVRSFRLCLGILLQAVGEQDVSSQVVLVGIIESLDYPEGSVESLHWQGFFLA